MIQSEVKNAPGFDHAISSCHHPAGRCFGIGRCARAAFSWGEIDPKQVQDDGASVTRYEAL